MNFPVRNSVKIILLNEADELLLMCVDEPKTTAIGEDYKGPFWCMIGGEIEAGETPLQAAERELFEETGIVAKDVTFGPLVWFGECDLILYGRPTRLKQQFVVGRTKEMELSRDNLTPFEAMIVKRFSYFSLDEIRNSDEIIYPAIAREYLSDIIAGNYPKEPIEIELN